MGKSSSTIIPLASVAFIFAVLTSLGGPVSAQDGPGICCPKGWFEMEGVCFKKAPGLYKAGRVRSRIQKKVRIACRKMGGAEVYNFNLVQGQNKAIISSQNYRTPQNIFWTDCAHKNGAVWLCSNGDSGRERARSVIHQGDRARDFVCMVYNVNKDGHMPLPCKRGEPVICVKPMSMQPLCPTKYELTINVRDGVTNSDTTSGFTITWGSESVDGVNTVAFGSFIAGESISLDITAPGYISLMGYSVILDPTSLEYSVFLSPSLAADENARAVLSWGPQPDILDSHTRTSDGCHVFFAITSCNAASGNVAVQLDRDNISGGLAGPETTTFKELGDGESHLIYINNFSGNSIVTLSTSGAQVTIYTKMDGIHVFNVNNDPTLLERYWLVACITGNAGGVTVTEVNIMTNDEPTDQSVCP